MIEDFVDEAAEAVESKRLPRTISETGGYTSIFNKGLYDLFPLVEPKELICGREC